MYVKHIKYIIHKITYLLYIYIYIYYILYIHIYIYIYIHVYVTGSTESTCKLQDNLRYY